MTEASQADLRQAEEELVGELMERAKNQLTGVNSDGDVHIRDILPDADLDADDGSNNNGWNGTNREWLQSGLTADQLEQVYEIDSSNKAENKVIGIFAVSAVSTDILTTEIVFEDATGGRFERLMFQESWTNTEGDYALLRNPIIFNEGKDAVIYQWPNADGDEQLIYHGAVAEKAGKTLGTRAQQEAAPQGTARMPSR